MEFGKRLEEARKANGLEQVDVAKKLGVKPSIYHLWEKGRKGKQIYPDHESLINLSRILTVSINWLVTGEQEKDRIARNKKEVDLLRMAREAESLGVAEKIFHYGKYTMQEAKKENEGK